MHAADPTDRAPMGSPRGARTGRLEARTRAVLDLSPVPLRFRGSVRDVRFELLRDFRVQIQVEAVVPNRPVPRVAVELFPIDTPYEQYPPKVGTYWSGFARKRFRFSSLAK